MAECTTNVDLISDNEYIGDSLSKINQNFKNLRESSCDLKGKLDRQVNIRTFFYYGPNTPSDPQDGTAGMDNNALTRPSDDVIQDFVNDTDKLNLPSISEERDMVYVVYQKTGWYVPPVTKYTREGSGRVPFTKVVTYYVPDPPDPRGALGGSKRKIGIAGKCWVAREVYDFYSPRWEIFKDWLFDSGKGPVWLQKIYLKYGQNFANWISAKTSIKNILQKLFNIVVNKPTYKDISFVTTPEGSINAANIKTGDTIYGYDHITGQPKECKVLSNQTIKSSFLLKIYHEYGEVVVPAEQKIYTEDGNTGEALQYIEAKNLTSGSYIYLEDNSKSKIVKIEILNSKTPIQKIEVEDTHNYILNGVKVHNGYVTVVVTYYVGYSWTTTIEDTYKQYEPIFVLYRLTFNGDMYIMDSGWPKYSRGSTGSTINWNSPQLWNTY
jgi:hypothetical protein